MSKPFPAFCKDCVWSKPEERSECCLQCHNPTINASDPWTLSSASTAVHGHGSSCHGERENKSWFAKCGMKGKLWTAK